ncbi:MAG: DoxX family membrane protein, partial [Candidatus Neomarinimicrobiota bacterium]
MKVVKIFLSNLNNTDLGLLIIRTVFGILMYVGHGHGKLLGGVDRWYGLGGALTNLIGFEFLRTFFGLMASLSESIFALFIVAGLLTRISSSLLGFTMFIATLRHVLDG